MIFKIYHVENGFLLNVYYSREKIKSYIFLPTERIRMFEFINQTLGPEPESKEN